MGGFFPHANSPIYCVLHTGTGWTAAVDRARAEPRCPSHLFLSVCGSMRLVFSGGVWPCLEREGFVKWLNVHFYMFSNINVVINGFIGCLPAGGQKAAAKSAGRINRSQSHKRDELRSWKKKLSDRGPDTVWEAHRNNTRPRSRHAVTHVNKRLRRSARTPKVRSGLWATNSGTEAYGPRRLYKSYAKTSGSYSRWGSPSLPRHMN